MISQTTLIFLQGFILIAAMVDDFKTRKVHNWLVLSLAAVAITASFLAGGFEAIKFGAFASGLAFLMCFPLVTTKIMGAGDMKLLMAFAFATTPMPVFWTLLYSFLWGGLLGLFVVILKKQGRKLFHNMFALVTHKMKITDSETHKIPYTVALFFGWLTFIVTSHQGGGA